MTQNINKDGGAERLWNEVKSARDKNNVRRQKMERRLQEKIRQVI